MYRFLLFTIFIFTLFTFTGCINNTVNTSQVDVYVDGDGHFPQSLAGLWKAENADWEISLKPDGDIKYAVISMGKVQVKPGEVTKIEMMLGGEGQFIPGKWTVRYLQEQRQLIVEIAIDSFRTELGKDIVYGKTRDYFSGTVSENGKVWLAERYSYPEYYVDTDKYQNYPLPVDPNENPREEITFVKVD